MYEEFQIMGDKAILTYFYRFVIFRQEINGSCHKKIRKHFKGNYFKKDIPSSN